MSKGYISRAIEPELLAAAKEFPVLVVTGARQTGKSTLLRHAFPRAAYVTLDDPLTRQAALEDPRTFLARAPQLIIDEIQSLPELLPHIKIAVDADRHAHGHFLLTGSQVFPLMSGIGESLAGRAAIYHLRPFSCAEMRWDTDTPQTCFQKIFNGFYPEILAHSADSRRFFSSYVQTYLERDIRLLTAVHDLRLFQAFVELLAARVGALLNLNEIAKEVGVSFPTARRWLSLLESTGIVFLLRPFSRNITRRVTKSPKLYFGDTGLVTWLLRYPNAETLQIGPHSGALFENLVILELLKHRDNHALNYEFFFYRDSSANEIDLVLDAGVSLSLIEIKQTATPRAEHFKTIKNLFPLFPNATGYVCSLTAAEETFSANLFSIPFHTLIEKIPNYSPAR
jgi:predicted AAA+ superfamily ATPase